MSNQPREPISIERESWSGEEGMGERGRGPVITSYILQYIGIRFTNMEEKITWKIHGNNIYNCTSKYLYIPSNKKMTNGNTYKIFCSEVKIDQYKLVFNSKIQKNKEKISKNLTKLKKRY